MENALINDDELLKNAVYQQLFLGNNQIMGKNPQYTMNIDGVNELLEKFIEDLKSQLKYLKTNNTNQFLHYFEKRFKMQLIEARQRINANFSNMDSKNEDSIVIAYMGLTKLLESLRGYSYRYWGELGIREKYRDMTDKYYTKKIAAKVQNLAATNNEDISLLYNLSFLRMLAETYSNKAMIAKLQELIAFRIEKIMQKIIN